MTKEALKRGREISKRMNEIDQSITVIDTELGLKDDEYTAKFWTGVASRHVFEVKMNYKTLRPVLHLMKQSLVEEYRDLEKEFDNL